MALKRHLSEENDLLGLPIRELKRQHLLLITFRDVEGMTRMLEPFIRGVVREEVERGILHYHVQSTPPRPAINQIQASVERGWQLQFKSRLPRTLFTVNKIEAEDNTPVQIVIVKANSKEIITSGPLSSIKIEILALDGAFGSAEQENWTEEEFDAKVLRARDGKEPLLKGNLLVSLKNGIVNIEDINFTDNSSWIKCGKFRLGARVVRSLSEQKIKEARTEAFIVKDHRGESYKKHYPPCLSDEVWRLEHIGKDGVYHCRLIAEGINTVQDFLRFLVMDETSLRNILGNVSKKKWEKTVQHVKMCPVDNKRYFYCNAEQQVVLLFDSIFQVVEIKTKDGWQSLDNLPASQKNLVEILKQHAYKNHNDIVELGTPSLGSPPRSLLRIDSSSFPGSRLTMQDPHFSITQDGIATQPDFTIPMIPPFNVPTGDLYEPNNISLQPTQLFTSIQMNGLDMRDQYDGTYQNCANGVHAGGSAGPIFPDGYLAGGGIPQVQLQSWHSPSPAMWGQGKVLSQAFDDEIGADFLNSVPDISFHVSEIKANMGWYKILAVIKLRSAGKAAARKRALSFLRLGK